MWQSTIYAAFTFRKHTRTDSETMWAAGSAASNLEIQSACLVNMLKRNVVITKKRKIWHLVITFGSQINLL